MTTDSPNRITLDRERSPSLSQQGPPVTGGGDLDEREAQARQRARAALLAQCYQAGDEYYLKGDKPTLAFRDDGDQLVALTDDKASIQAMMELARAKGWQAIRLSGTAEFRSEAWLHASTLGMQVDGYQPSALDEAKLAEHRTAQTIPPPSPSEAAPAPSVRHQAALAAMEAMLRAHSPQHPKGHTEAHIAAARASAHELWANNRVFMGRITAHGGAPLHHAKDGPASYYIQVQHAQGTSHTLWGLDLKRAVLESQSTPSEEVAVEYRGSVAEKGPGLTPIQRNAWQITPLRALSPAELRAAQSKAAFEVPEPTPNRVPEHPPLAQARVPAEDENRDRAPTVSRMAR